MKLLVGFFFVCSIGFGQSENDSIAASKTIGLLGYQFYNGQLGVFSIDSSVYLQTGILQTKSLGILVTEMPILAKKQITNNSTVFFGSKLNMVQNPLFSILNQGNPQFDYGVSTEVGLQYDVNPNMMLEIRYSSPFLKNKGFYPDIPTIDTLPMFRLGTGIKF